MKTDVVIVGTGNIAFKHASIVRKLYPKKSISLYNYRKKVFSKKDISDYKISNIFNSILDENDEVIPNNIGSFAIIASPASHHIKHSSIFAKKKFHILLEKPLMSENTLLNNLTRDLKRNNLISHVAYNMQFLSCMIMLKKILMKKLYGNPLHCNITALTNFIKWRPNKNFKKTVTASRSLGGGVVNELSHEIDYMKYLFGYPISYEFSCNKSNKLKLDIEDSCNSRFLYKNMIVNISLDILSSIDKRTCCIQFEHAFVLLNIQKNIIQVFKDNEIYKTYNFDKNMQDTYIDQIKHFVKRIKNNIHDEHEIINYIPLTKILLSMRSSR